MADEGPTVVGSIVAKVKGDESDWLITYTRVKAQAKEIGSLDPTIDIGETGAAATMAKIAALEAETDKLASADNRLRVASNGVNDSNSRGLQHWQLIAGLIAALVPLIGPLSTYAVAVSGALAGMGAAGVLAVLGVKRAMEEGNATGQAYRDGLTKLQGLLHTLEDSAAAGMLTHFAVAVQTLSQALPFLNGQVGTFTGLLGTAGTYALTGVVNLLRTLNPLFIAGGAYVKTLAENFERWTTTGQLQRFVSYSLTELPQVEHTIGSLSTMVIHLVESLSPLGNVAIRVLGIFADLINAMPTDQVLELTLAVGGAFIAFQAWEKIVPILVAVANAVGLVNLATELTAGPVGLVVAALGALAGILAGVALSSDTATQAQQNYTAAIEASSGAIDANVKKIAAKALLDDGSLEAAKKLGISTSLLVDATTGNTAAQSELQQQIDAVTKAQEKYGHVVVDGHDKIIPLTQAQREQQGVLATLTDGYSVQSGAIQSTIANNTLLNGSLNSVTITAGITKAQFDALGASINALPKSVGITLSTSGQVAFSDSRNSATGRASGGKTLPGELTLVGEYGSEYARFPAGTEIYSHGVTPLTAPGATVNNSSSTSSSVTEKHYHLHIDGTGKNDDALFTEFTRRQNLQVA